MNSDLKEAFEQFMRNDRFGTCVDCPRAGKFKDGIILPELCKYTERYDHQLRITRLVEIYHREKLLELVHEINERDKQGVFTVNEIQHIAYIRYNSGWGAGYTDTELVEMLRDDDGMLMPTPVQSLMRVRDYLDDK